MLTGNDGKDSKYLKVISSGGLESPSQLLCDYVCSSLALIDALSFTIQKSDLPVRSSTEFALEKAEFTFDFVCEAHSEIITKTVNRILTNVYFNIQRKWRTSSITSDKVKQLKRLKRLTV